jgi:hypothetical protein
VARLYADENFPFPVIARLRQMGHDVRTVQETGRAGEGLPDEQVLSFAVVDQRAVITLNRFDFIRLHRKLPSHFGIVVCKTDNDVESLALRINHAINSIPDLQGLLVRVNRQK